MNNLLKRLEKELKKRLPGNCPALLRSAMEYCLLSGGKRLRPLLLLSVYKAYGGKVNNKSVWDFASALEMIHTYSLIHDDLPSMDNDDTRRGKPSCHIKFGEAMAILTGDALLNRAYEVMIESVADNTSSDTIAAMSVISGLAGADGLVGGQVGDITDCGVDIIDIYTNKTASLFMAACIAGGCLSDVDIGEMNKLCSLGSSFGVLFQIKDDIADAANEIGKVTLVSIGGMDRAKEFANNVTKNVYEELDALSCPAADKKLLRELIDQITGGGA